MTTKAELIVFACGLACRHPCAWGKRTERPNTQEMRVPRGEIFWMPCRWAP